MDESILQHHLDNAAKHINGGQIGLASLQPESWAKPLCCYENVFTKVKQSGGIPVFGWSFLLKHAVQGDYLVAQHHAVWGLPGNAPIDITPYVQEAHPLTINGSVLFLMDLHCYPIIINGQIAPTASKFYKITNSAEMEGYIQKLQSKEHAECESIYNKLRIA